MKTRQIMTLFAAILGVGLLTGCPNNGQEAGAPQPQGDPVTIVITGNDRMRFDPEQFTVQARQPVTLVFRNVGTMPKASMGHNLVVLQRGVDKVDFANAGSRHVRNEFIDPERANQVIASTIVLGPGEEDHISFVAPAESGDYDFICSFPGHTQAGMVGVMTVE
jgi:azurin